MDRIKLGQITAPVGIKGEIRVYPYLEQARFSDVKKVCLDDGKEMSVERVRTDKNMIVLKLSGVDDRNRAEQLRNRILYLPETESLDLGEDTYYVDDLKGLSVTDINGTQLGILTEVISRIAQDLYEVKRADGKSFLIPAVKEFIVEVDMDSRTMKVNIPEGLMEL